VLVAVRIVGLPRPLALCLESGAKAEVINTKKIYDAKTGIFRRAQQAVADEFTGHNGFADPFSDREEHSFQGCRLVVGKVAEAVHNLDDIPDRPGKGKHQ